MTKKPLAKKNAVITEEGLLEGLQYRIGSSFLLKDSGVYYRTEDNKSGKANYSRIAGPLFIKNTVRNFDEKKVQVDLVYKQHGKYFDDPVGGGQIAIPNELIKLNDNGAEIPYEYKKLIVTYLREQEKETTYKEVYSKIGFHKNDKAEWEYRHRKIIPKRDVVTEYDEKNGAFQLTPKGDLQVWKKMIEEEVEGYTPLEFIVAVGFTAPLVGYLSQTIKSVNTLFVNLNTKSTVGKTTSAMLAVSAFGEPNLKEPKSLVQQWGSTGNSIMDSFNGNMGIPIVLDELSMNENKELTSMFYAIVSGVGKGRLTDLIKQREKDKWATTIISTGEISALTRANENAGVKIRIKEFSDVQWTKSSENADKINEVITENYGHSGISFIQHLFKLGLTKVEELWRSWLIRVEKALPATPYTARLAKDYAVIMTAVTLVNDALDLSLSEDDILAFIVEHEEKASVTRNTGLVAYEKIKQILIEHQSNFRQDGLFSTPQKCWGKITYHNDYVEFAVMRDIMKQLLKGNGFENVATVTKEWKRDGHLLHEDGRQTSRCSIFGPSEQDQRRRALGIEKLPSKPEDVTYKLKIPTDELQGLLGRIRTAESFKNDSDVAEALE